VNNKVHLPRDQKDAKFLECALSANADFLITGDRDFHQAQKLVNTTIISVSLFKKLICDVLS
ncbi:MAG TPA: putative toxin-antitoxin system toxin component, PIN family, partial [Deltaproteobacteria bacterium]|nr:putative toxin-antitoxin system toxin component, PIN family [Deltaproteobacteria bacterium]